MADIKGTSGNDPLTGTTVSDTIAGLGGDDTINGLAGDDQITGGIGNDSVDGGDGNDLYNVAVGDGFDSYHDTGATGTDSILASANNVAIGLQSGFGPTSGIELISANGHTGVTILGGAEDTVFDFSATTLTGITNINGGAGNDTITGSAGADTITGGMGNDTLNGGQGGDTYLVGVGHGTDIYKDTGTTGTDTILASENNVALGLASGFGPASGIEVISANGHTGVTIAGGAEDTTFNFSATTLTGIVNINGGAGNDTITGSAGADTIIGGTGNDILNGGQGSDTYQVGVGHGIDTYGDTGTTGTDTILATANNVAIGLASGFNAAKGIEVIDAGGHTGVTIVGGAEDTVFDFSATTLTGIANINGGAGNDTITGSAGADTIIGGIGNDILKGGQGGDTYLVGVGHGIDTYSDTGSTGTDTILASANNAAIGLVSGFNAAKGIEVIDAGGHTGVTIVGGSENTVFDFAGMTLTGIADIDGGAGLDTITGSAGADTIVGGAGNDTLNGGEGGDTYLIGLSSGYDLFKDTGTTGTDTILASADNAAIGLIAGFGPVNGIEAISANGHSGVTILDSIASDKLDFSNVTLTGITAIDGASGADNITGSAGDDTIIGGQGNDILNGGQGSDTYLVGVGAGSDTYKDTGTTGTDTILATADNIVIGLSGFNPASGIEAIGANGHAGITIADTSNSDTLDFSAATLTGITAIDGGAGNDTITGSSAADTIIGGAGNDTLNGGEGGDTYLVGAGAGFDVYKDKGTTGTDSILASTDNVVIGVQSGFGAPSGIEAIGANGHAGVTIGGGTGNDTLDFSTTTLTGIAEIDGGAGNDTIKGSAGADAIAGGVGVDTLTGGADKDTFVFNVGDTGATTGTRDTITDFTTGTDQLDTSKFGALNFIGSAAFDGAGGELHTVYDAVHNVTIVEGDTNGDKTGDFGIELNGNLTLSEGDFAEGSVVQQQTGDHAGWSVAGLGDVNKDGYDDFIVGAPGADAKGADAGAAYVIFGNAQGVPLNLDLSALNGSNGFKITGAAAGDAAGYSVQAAGDINGDGYADIVVGAPYADPNGASSGSAYVIFGNATFSPSISLASLNGTNGFTLVGVAAGDFTGASVHAAGDVNKDGYADLIVGADGANVNTTDSGAVFTVFGHSGSFGAQLDLASLDGDSGAILYGAAASDHTGWSVAAAGDVNGDGVDDMIVGAPGAGYHNVDGGAAYIVFGHANYYAVEPEEIDRIVIGADVPVRAEGNGDAVGFSVAGAGDVNGDGFDDVVIGAAYADENGQDAGAAYVVFGSNSILATYDFELSKLNGSNGFKIYGIEAADLAGFSVSSAGDVNGDGYADIIIGAPNAGADGAGMAYVIYGHGGSFPAEFDLSTLTSKQGFVISGEGAGEGLGFSVSSGGDLNADGFDDLVVGEPFAGANGTQTGAFDIIYGSDTLGLNQLIGGFGSQTLTGGAGNDTIYGLAGDDKLSGLAGADFLNGGDGDDTIQGGAGSDKLTGGAGNDTFVYILADFAASSPDRITDFSPGIDRIDLTAIDANPSTPQHDPFHLLSSFHGGEAPFDGTPGALQIFYDATAGKTLVEGDTNGDRVADFTIKLDGILTLGADSFTNGSVIQEHRTSAIVNDRFFQLSVDYFAGVAAGAGDFNHDGFADVMAAVPGSIGVTHIFYGSANGLPSIVDLSNANNGENTAWGAAGGDTAGFSLGGSGDFNGDGIDDILIGAPSVGLLYGSIISDSGHAYVVFGSDTKSSFNLGELTPSQGVAVHGNNQVDLAGSSVDFAGDVNGDGLDDIIVGASHDSSAQTAAGSLAGNAYVVFGSATPFANQVELTQLTGADGFRIHGESAQQQLGLSVSGAGDVNGDGYADLLVNSATSNPSGQATYVLFGHAGTFSPDVLPSDLDGTNGFAVTGLSGGTSNYRENSTVSSAGDVNGDGYDDIVIGDLSSGRAGSLAGAAYVVFGHGGGFDPSIDVADLNGINGFALLGSGIFAEAGATVSSAGDINGDGYADFIVGAPASSMAYVLYGKVDGFDAVIDLGHLDPDDGFAIQGDISGAGDATGASVSSAGDVDGDGFDDLLIGAPQSDLGEPIASHGIGAVTIVYGASTDVSKMGTAGNDTLTGTSVAETIVGAQGNDTLNGGGGADSIRGGSGDDHIHVADRTFHHVDGGSGMDTLHLDFAGAIDFANLDGNAATSDRGKISNIETIDVTNGQNNAMTLHLADVLDLDVRDTNVGGKATLDNTLTINGNAGDTLHLSTADGWSAADTSTLAGYAIYTHQAVHVAVDTDIAVTVN